MVLSVLLCLLHLSTTSEQENSTQEGHHTHPCMPSDVPQAYDIFLKRHLTADQPDSLDQNQWQRFIEKHRLCHRPTQSFLRPEDKHQVLDVCSSTGGRVLRDNLCISGQKFSFITVRLDTHHCLISSVIKETKHLILACDDISNVCRPVHFQGNPGDLKPDWNRQPPCERYLSAHAVLTTAGLASLLLSLSFQWFLWN